MKFSVIIPVYNKADTIEDSINSVLQQTVQDFEIVVVDDGSTDNLEKMIPNNSCIQLIRQKNSGVSVARNTGIEHATGEYICFLDADDLWKSNHLETLLFLIKKYSDCGYYLTSHIVTMVGRDDFYSSVRLKNFEDDFICSDLLGLLNATSDSIIHTNSVCVKKSILERENIKFEPGIKIGEDSDVWYRLGLRNKVAISKIETTIYQRENSTATKNSFYVQDWVFSLRENDIIQSSDILKDRKISAIKLIDRYRLTSSREYMITNNRKDAKRMLSEVRYKEGKTYWITRCYAYLPYFICRYLYKKIMRKQ